MAKDEVKNEKKPSKALPGLIFLLGVALIVGGVLMGIVSVYLIFFTNRVVGSLYSKV